ncbi:pyridoxal phosphate-dependent aminotransferase [Pyrobaculum neutrophilum]|uniref:Aminotransferase class I and II n=1 Tax=Pyrobaculum neutrophilum (strain DSM 2338 / JCM 9278 / NBRC 100436 / V24Sta) TaxID=444157 RepID=B1Y9A7_PYRNV|nr:pyridoxal phosphate-dependent aminotransferase [Pyrobaculum neutrophilum]ACB40336.1 aminotransferase class I and II [Pyrobaculum neutrophilum V24Sta]
MRGFSSKIGALRESPTRKIDELREKLKRENRDVILLSTGQPSVPPPREVREAMKNLLGVDSMELYGYTPSLGTYEAREAISEDLKRLGGVDVPPEQIVLTAGGQAAMFSTLATLLEAGDEVVVTDPTYFGYRPLIEYFGASVKYLRTRLEDGFQPRPEELRSLVGRRTKALVLVSPDNPTGRTLKPEAAKAIVDLARDYDFWIIVDEAYKTLIYEGGHVYLYKLAPERTISINTFSKDPAIPGWRLGYVYGPPEVMPKIKLMNEEMVYCPPSFAQKMVTLYLRSEARMRYVREVVEIYRQRRDVAVSALRKYLPEARFVVPSGSMFVFVDLSSYVLDGESFAKQLLERYGVAVVPGSYFSEVYKAAVRISFVSETPERIEEGIRRMGEAAGAL